MRLKIHATEVMEMKTKFQKENEIENPFEQKQKFQEYNPPFQKQVFLLG